MDLKIDEDYKQCLPELSKEEYTELEKSIVKDGVLNPILVWNGVIIDGHNRYAICKTHRIEKFPTKEIVFDSKDEALEWILRNQLGRRNLTDFQRNEVALKYESVIAKRMKERQIAGLKRGTTLPLSSFEDNGREARRSGLSLNEEKAANKRNHKDGELGKIAGTSESSIYRTRQILTKGTPEQIERARKGGKGNSVSAIAKEIELEQKGVETRKCKRCGKILPVTDFYPDHHKNFCKKCVSSNKIARDFKGRRIEILPELQRMTEEEIIGDFYNTEKEIVYTDDDLEEELNAKIENFKWSVQNCLQIHMDILKNEESKEKVLRNLTLLQEEIQKWKELYDYE